MRNRVLDAQAGFEGGLNTTADESQLGPKQVRRAVNARLTEYGGITKRLGTRRIHALAIHASPIRGGFAWKKADGTVQELVSVNGKLYVATFSPTATSWTDQVGAISTTAIPSFAAFRNGSAEAVYLADGGKLNVWDGAAFTVNIAATPDVGLLAVYNLRLFGAGDPANPDTLYWSAFDDGDTLGDVANGGGSARVRTFGLSKITALTPLQGSLLIWHRDGISRFTGWGQDDIDIDAGTEGVTSDIGTISPNSILVVENYAYCLTDRGVYRVSGGGEVTEISPSISSVFRTLDRDLLHRACAIHNRRFGEIWFYLPDVGVYVYNYRWQAWSGPWEGLYTDRVVHSMWETIDTDGNPIVLLGMDDGIVRQADVMGFYLDDVQSELSSGSESDYFGDDYFGTDYYGDDWYGGTGLVDLVAETGDEFTMEVQCRRFFFGDQFEEKSLRWLWVTAALRGSTTALLNYSMQTREGERALDGGELRIWGEGTWGEGMWDSGGSRRIRVAASGRGVSLDVTIEDSGASDSVYSRVEAEAFAMGRR